MDTTEDFRSARSGALRLARAGGIVAALILVAASAHGGPLPLCGSQFDYNCAEATVGGYTVITPLGGTGQTEITGFNSSNGVVFDQTIPIPPTGPAGSDVQEAVLHADALIAVQSGLASSLPACSPSSGNPCVSPNPGGAVTGSASSTFSYVAVDTPVTQQVDQYSTTLIATLNGSAVFSETFLTPFSDPSVQSAVSAADALLMGDSASFGAPFLASSSTSLLGSQVSYVQTGEGADGSSSITTSQTIGPAAIFGCFNASPCEDFRSDLSLVLSGQGDINLNTDFEIAIDRNVVTTNTDLITQTYDIAGVTESSVPEPATWGPIALALAAIIVARAFKRGFPIPDPRP